MKNQWFFSLDSEQARAQQEDFDYVDEESYIEVRSLFADRECNIFQSSGPLDEVMCVVDNRSPLIDFKCRSI